MRNCPSEFDLAAFIDGALEETEADAIRQHVARCTECSHAIVDVVSLQDREAVDLLQPLSLKEQAQLETGLSTAQRGNKVHSAFRAEEAEDEQSISEKIENFFNAVAGGVFVLGGLARGGGLVVPGMLGAGTNILKNVVSGAVVGASMLHVSDDVAPENQNLKTDSTNDERPDTREDEPSLTDEHSNQPHPVNTSLSKTPRFRPDDFTHPEDKAALSSLEKIPFFPQILKAFLKTCPEQMLHGLNMAQKIRLGPCQLPEIYEILPPICQELGIAEPELYLEMDPTPNAYTFGDSKVFITVTSGLIEALTPEEVKTVIAHECGHIACRHTLYHTLASLVVMQGVEFLGLPKVVVLPLVTALTYWSRRSELSADRAAALIMRDSRLVVETMIRLSGGPKSITSNVDVKLYAQQAEAYDQLKDSKWDKFLQGMATMSMTHPLPAVRAREITKWCESAAYTILIKP